MNTNIWIMNHYASSMYFDKGGRHYAFAKYMRREGYNPVVFCCNSKHGNNQVYFDNDVLFTVKKEKDIDVPFVFVKGRPYTGNGKTRILNMVDFYFNVQRSAKIYAKKHGKPDVIYASSVHPLTLVAGIKLAKHFGVKCVCEIRDLWPESLVAYNVIKKNNPLVFLLRQVEKWTYTKTDRIIFTMEGGSDYIEDQNWGKYISKSKVFYINNGIDIEQYDYNIRNFVTYDDDLDNNNIIKVVYAGSINKANNMNYLLDVASQITSRTIRFLIWGDGEELVALKRRKEKEDISNVIFKGRIQKQFIPYIIANSDINFLDPFDIRVSRYGVSSNKLFEYIKAGKPVLMNDIGKYNPIRGYAYYYDSSPEKTAKIIERLAKIDILEKKRIAEGLDVISQDYSFNNLTSKLIECIDGL